jgi:hypothetical protein
MVQVSLGKNMRFHSKRITKEKRAGGMAQALA